jgi:hypothetical protein
MDLQQLIDQLESGNFYVASELETAGEIAEVLGGKAETVYLLNERGERAQLYLFALIVRRLEADRLQRDGVFCKECGARHETAECPHAG